MTQAMRTAALVELVSSLGADPHKVPDDVLRVILDNALKLARAHGYRPPDGKADGTAPRRQATGERSAVAGDGLSLVERLPGDVVLSRAHAVNIEHNAREAWEACQRGGFDDATEAIGEIIASMKDSRGRR